MTDHNHADEHERLQQRLIELIYGLLSEDEAADYAKEVVASDFEEPGDDDVVRKVLSDLEKSGADLSEHRLRNKMDELMAEAKQQVMNE